MKVNKQLYKFNLKKNLKNITNSLVNECVEERKKFNKNTSNLSFLINLSYKNYLYKLFLNKCKKIFKKFTLQDTNFKCWCYFSDKTFTKGIWHNHINTCTINGVLYLKLPKNEKGIDFLINNKLYNFVPKELDFIIFPNYLYHFPYPSVTEEPRISINLELRCLENSKKIFQ